MLAPKASLQLHGFLSLRLGIHRLKAMDRAEQGLSGVLVPGDRRATVSRDLVPLSQPPTASSRHPEVDLFKTGPEAS